MTSNDNELQFTESDIVQLICSIDNEDELYYTFNALFVSKEYCHMVLNNEIIF